MVKIANWERNDYRDTFFSENRTLYILYELEKRAYIRNNKNKKLSFVSLQH